MFLLGLGPIILQGWGPLIFLILSIPVIFIGFLIYSFTPKGKEEFDKMNHPIDTSKMTPEQRLAYLKAQNSMLDAQLAAKNENKASVTKRAVIGGIIGGTPGAIIGAASAIDKNNKKK